MENMKSAKKLLCCLTMIAAAILMTLCFGTAKTDADQLTPTFTSSDGSACTNISDGYYSCEDLDNSYEAFEAGTEITLTSDQPIDSIYITFYYKPGTWKIRSGDKEYTYGENSFLHEYVKLPDDIAGTNSLTIILSEKEWIIDIYAFSEGELPDFVQTWEEPYDKADILLLSTHADDEVLFFGGIIPNYTDKSDVRVQVAYFTDLFQTEPYRAQEILDGLWEMGVTHYPQLGEFYDYYSESYDEAASQYDHDASLEYVTRIIRKFKPQVVVAQDMLNGEYGHGGHMWSATMVAEAIKITGDASQYPESAELYGTWEVLKTYMHLYPENQILLDARVPLASFDGRTALEVAEAAYLKHVSQQWCWFYVDDDCIDPDGNATEQDLRCTLYGLYDTKVGADTLGNDILEHITPYDDQEAAAAQVSTEISESESSDGSETTAADGSDAQQGENQDSADAAVSDETAPDSSIVIDQTSISTQTVNHSTLITILIIIAAILLVIIIIIFILEKKREKAEKQRRTRRIESRNAEDYRQIRSVRPSGRYEHENGQRAINGRRPENMQRSSNARRQAGARCQSEVRRTADGRRIEGERRTADGRRAEGERRPVNSRRTDSERNQIEEIRSERPRRS